MNARAQRVIEDVKKGRKPDAGYSPAMRSYYQLTLSDVCDSPTHAITFSIYKDPYQRGVVEALILSGADPIDVATAFDIPEESYKAFEELFFDSTQFRTKLDKISYIENCGADEHKDLKLWAFTLGPEYIYFRLVNILPKSEKQQELVHRMFMSTAYKAMAMNFNGINSVTTKAAVEHAKVMLKAYEAMQKFSDDGAPDKYDLVKVLTTTANEIQALKEPIPTEAIM